MLPDLIVNFVARSEFENKRLSKPPDVPRQFAFLKLMASSSAVKSSSIRKSGSVPPSTTPTKKNATPKNATQTDATKPTSPVATSTISAEDYLALVDKCYWLQSHLRNLDHQLNNATFRLQSVQDQRLTNCWFALSLVELRRLTNLVVRLMFELQTATMGKSVDSDYYKFALDQLCYFEFLWRCYFVERILQLNNRFRTYMTKHSSERMKATTSKSQAHSKKSTDSKQPPEEDPLISIMKDVQPTLANVRRTRKHRKEGEKMPELDLAKESAAIRLDSSSSERDLSREQSGEENVQRKSGESLEAKRIDSKTADLLDAESREAADLIALGQLEAAMRVNQQLMECIRNHISMAKVTIQNIQKSGQRSLHQIERTSRNVQITKQISRLSGYGRSLRCLLLLIVVALIVFFVISHFSQIKQFFQKDAKQLFEKAKKSLGVKK